MRAIYMKTNSIGTIMNTSRDAHSIRLFAYFSYHWYMTLIDSFYCKLRAWYSSRRTYASSACHKAYHESVADSYSALIIFSLFIIFSHNAVGHGCILVILMSYIWSTTEPLLRAACIIYSSLCPIIFVDDMIKTTDPSWGCRKDKLMASWSHASPVS